MRLLPYILTPSGNCACTPHLMRSSGGTRNSLSPTLRIKCGAHQSNNSPSVSFPAGEVSPKCFQPRSFNARPLAVRAIRPNCIKYGSITSSIADAMSDANLFQSSQVSILNNGIQHGRKKSFVFSKENDEKL